MDNRYGIDLKDLFNMLPTYEAEVASLPTKLQGATNFKNILRIEHSRMMQLYKVLQDIYYLNDLNYTSGQSLDYAGADLGLLRGKYTDAEFRDYIRLYDANNRYNGGTIPDIKKAIKIVFPEDYSVIKVLDNFDGTVRITLPTSIMSNIFTDTGMFLTAAGIEMIIEIISSFNLGMLPGTAHETVRDRDNHRMVIKRNKKITTGKLCARYGSRVDIGMEV